jgi:hypothetical protein
MRFFVLPSCTLALFLLAFANTAHAASVKLAWDAATDGVTKGYVVLYGTAPGQYTGSINVGLVATYTITNLTAGTRYCFVAQAYDAAGTRSDSSSEVCTTTAGTAPSAPAPSTPSAPNAGSQTTPSSPSGSTNPSQSANAELPSSPRELAVRIVDGNVAELTWTPHGMAVAGYQVEVGSASERTDVGVYSTGVTTTFTVRALDPATYHFRVRGKTADGRVGPASNEVTVVVGTSATGGSTAPRQLQASVNGKTLQLSWQAPQDSGGVTAYLVEAGSSSGQANLGMATTGATSLLAPNLPDGVYFVRVRAMKGSEAGPASNEVVATIGGNQPPIGITGSCDGSREPLQLGASARGSIVEVAWQRAANALGYVVEVGSAPGRRDLGAFNFDANTTSFSSPAPNGTYVLRVMAITSCGAARTSNDVSVTVGGPAPALPGSPVNLISHVEGRTVTLTWVAPGAGGAATRYVIEARDAAGNILASVDTGNPSTTFTHHGTGAGTYIVTVRAGNAAGVGPPSTATTVTVK